MKEIIRVMNLINESLKEMKELTNELESYVKDIDSDNNEQRKRKEPKEKEKYINNNNIINNNLFNKINIINNNLAGSEPFCQQIKELWNLLVATDENSRCQKISKITKSRKRAINGRIKENKEFKSICAWEMFFLKIKGSMFLLGHNQHDWSCTFDWCLKPNNFTRIIENQFKKDENIFDLQESFIDSL